MKRCLRCDRRFHTDAWTCPRCGWAPATKGEVPLFAPSLDHAPEGFDSRYFEDLYRLERGSFWFRSRNALIVWAIERFFASAANVLEVGCGTGFVLAAIEKARPQLHVYGSDLHSEGLCLASRRLQRARLLQMDARAMPYDDEFDLLAAFDVLEHVEEDEAVLNEAHRSVKGRGGLLVTVPQHPFLWSAADDYAYHKRRYTRRELLSKVKRAGFETLFCTSFVSLLTPALLVSRLAARRSDRFDPQGEFRIPPAANALFESIMSVERALIRRGIRMPFGGSLLLAALKQSRTTG